MVSAGKHGLNDGLGDPACLTAWEDQLLSSHRNRFA